MYRNRRDVLKTAMASAISLWAAPRRLHAQQHLAGGLSVLDGGGANILALTTPDGFLLVDSGAPKSGDQVISALKAMAPSAKVQILFNTHYHLDQTANNQALAALGAKIIAHERTRQWMSTDYWVAAEERYEKARPKAARPTEVFLTTGSLKAGTERIDYGHLMLAHTGGDIYVYFRNANVIAVGDVASPLRDPSLDYFTGAWIGGRVDAMDTLLKLTDDQTRFVPGYGPVVTHAEFKAERDMMEEVRARLFKQVREGDGPQDMLQAGVLNNLPRTWQNPDKFLYDAAKGLWAHHDKLDPNVV